LWCGVGRAGEPLTVGEAEVVSNVVAHSFALRAAAQETEAAGARLAEAQARRGPSVDAAAQAARYSGLEEAALGPQIVIPEISTRYGASLSVSQPLFTGGRLRAGVEAAGRQGAAAGARRDARRADVALEALAAYWTWSKACHALSSFDAAVARMEAHARDMRSRQEAGLATENDALATEVLLDRTRLQRQEARRRDELAQARLAFLMGRELPAGAVPAPAAALPADDPAAWAAALAEAMTNRRERAASGQELAAAEAGLRGARAAFWPQVSALARYENSRPNNLFFPPVDEWNDDAFAGVALQWNLLDWGLARSRAAEAAARREQARLSVEETDARIALEVREARIGLQNARERLALARRAEESAQRNLKVANDLWQGGLARHADVLDAHAQLTEARYDSTAAADDAALAGAALRHATGRLLAEYPR